MSNTTQALDHCHVAARAGDADQARYWLDKALRYVRQDGRLPMKMAVQPDGCTGIRLLCQACHQEETVYSLAQAATFGDQHYYCGGVVPLWVCSSCRGTNQDRDKQCRYCEADRDGAIVTISSAVWIPDIREYQIMFPHRYVVGSVSCNSMLRARRAARAMYPLQQMVVSILNGRSCAACTEPKHLPPEVES